MYLTLVLYICAMASVLAQCEVRYRDVNPKDDNGPLKFKEVDCERPEIISLENKNNLKQFMNPQPLEKFVQLNSDPGFVFDPSMIVARRCDGVCGDKLTIQALHSTKNTVHVLRYPEGNRSDSQCVSVEVEDHTNCTCSCLKSQVDCHHSQKFMADECACECKDEKMQKHKCETLWEKKWNATTCHCDCKEDPSAMKCMTGYTWDQKYCCCSKDGKCGKE